MEEEHSARQGLRKWTPAALLITLFVQFGLAHLCMGLLGREPWPAALLPGFGRVYAVSDGVESTRVEFRVELEGGEILTPPLTDAFASVPQSMHVSVCRRLRAMEAFSPEVEVWLLARGQRVAEGRAVVAVELQWKRERRPLGGGPSHTDPDPGPDPSPEVEVEEVRRVSAPR